MVARLRAPNVAAWLSGPQQGLAALNEAGQNLGRSIATGLTNLGSGIAEQRQEKESKRRFDIEKGFEGRRLDIAEYDAALRGERVDMEREDKANEAASAEMLLVRLKDLSAKINTTHRMGLNPDPADLQSFQASMDALGDEQAVHSALRSGGVPGTDEDIDALARRAATNAAFRSEIDATIQPLAAMGRKSPKAALAWAQAANIRAALVGEHEYLNTRLQLAQKGQKQREEERAAASLLEQKRAVAGGLRESALARGIPMQEVNTRMEMWLRNPKADVNSLMDDYDKYVHEQAMAKQRETGNEFRGNADARAERNADRQDEALAFRKQQAEERAAESKRRWEIGRKDRLDKEGRSDADKVAAEVDKEILFSNGWNPHLDEVLSDDDIRAGLRSKKVGPLARTNLERLAAKRGVSLVEGPPPESSLGEATVERWEQDAAGNWRPVK